MFSPFPAWFGQRSSNDLVPLRLYYWFSWFLRLWDHRITTFMDVPWQKNDGKWRLIWDHYQQSVYLVIPTHLKITNWIISPDKGEHKYFETTTQTVNGFIDVNSSDLPFVVTGILNFTAPSYNNHPLHLSLSSLCLWNRPHLNTSPWEVFVGVFVRILEALHDPVRGQVVKCGRRQVYISIEMLQRVGWSRNYAPAGEFLFAMG